MYRRKRSLVWRYFTPVDGFEAKCDLCKKSIFHSGYLRKLRNHLRIIHAIEQNKIQCRQEEEDKQEKFQCRQEEGDKQEKFQCRQEDEDKQVKSHCRQEEEDKQEKSQCRQEEEDKQVKPQYRQEEDDKQVKSQCRQEEEDKQEKSQCRQEEEDKQERSQCRQEEEDKQEKSQCRQEEEDKQGKSQCQQEEDKQENPECSTRARQTSMTEAFQGGRHSPVLPSALLPMALLAKRRHDSSLHLLTQRFLQLLCFSVDGVLDLRMAADVLKAPRRRLYDITNVLHGIGLIKKVSPRKVKWLGNAGVMIDKLLQVDIEEERQLDELIQTCTWHIYQMCVDQTSWRYAYLTYEDLQSIPSLKEQTVLVIKAPVDTTLEVPNPEESLQVHLSSTKGPIEVFFCSDDPIPVRTTDNAPACGSNATPPNSSTNRKGSLSPLPRSSFVQTSSEDGDNDTSRSNHISNSPFELSQHSSLVTVIPIPTLPSLQSPSEEEQSLVTLTPPTCLSVEGEGYSLCLAEDEGISNLFSGDLDCLDLDVHMV